MIFGIRGNTQKKELITVVAKLIKELRRKNINYLLDVYIARLIQKSSKIKLHSLNAVSDKELIKNSDFIISIGGDGTFLRTANIVGDKNIPIIGVNLGKLGFLADISTTSISNFLTKILLGKYRLEERSVLQAYASLTPDRKIYGLNEIVIGQSGIVKTILIHASYNKQLVNRYRADGLIVSTPTGSTGYSMSAGGPIVSPQSDVLILAPLNPHTLTARTMILPDKGTINVTVGSKVPVIVTADGNSIIKLNSPADITIKLADYKIKIVKSLSNNYFKVLSKKLFWGKDKRN